MTDYTTRLTMDQAHTLVGARVFYHSGVPGAAVEDGEITGTSSSYVFVRFGPEGTGSKACRPIDLELASEVTGD